MLDDIQVPMVIQNLVSYTSRCSAYDMETITLHCFRPKEKPTSEPGKMGFVKRGYYEFIN